MLVAERRIKDGPCGGYAPIDADAIGKEVVASIGRSSASLTRQQGVFTIGPTINKALQAAIMVEDVAHIWPATGNGRPPGA